MQQRKTVLSAIGIQTNNQDLPILKYGRNLTGLAAGGKFTELSHRPDEINRISDILLRKRKGNPVLSGPAGIGKTAIVELLVRDIVEGEVRALYGYSIYELSIGRMIAGTKYRGEFETRFEEVMRSLSSSSPAILFIDELHLLVGAGRAEGVTVDAANLLKPYLARDDFRVIGATTTQEYHKYIAVDKALARRFQELRLQEPGGEILFSMVSRQRDNLKNYHQIEISDKIIEKAIELTDRYLLNRCQPDKSIDLLDTTAVFVRKNGRTSIGADDLLEVLSSLTGTPIAVLSGTDRELLVGLSSELKKRIIGQDQAVEKVVRSLIQRRVDIGKGDRPLGVFLFAGDTGVGKTELARSLAELYFGKKERLVQIDLSEYAGPAAIHKLIGAPAGLVGYENEGFLIKGIQDHPASVILLDEIEKADPKVHKLLLGLLDNGRITSARGETYDARQSIIIMTTNAVRKKDLERQAIGFSSSVTGNDPYQILNRLFPEEFLGRIDEIISFNRLQKKDYIDITNLHLTETVKRLASKGVKLKYDQRKLAEYMVSRMETERSGARGLVRIIEKKLLQPLAFILLEQNPEEERYLVMNSINQVKLAGNKKKEGVT